MTRRRKCDGNCSSVRILERKKTRRITGMDASKSLLAYRKCAKRLTPFLCQSPCSRLVTSLQTSMERTKKVIVFFVPINICKLSAWTLASEESGEHGVSQNANVERIPIRSSNDRLLAQAVDNGDLQNNAAGRSDAFDHSCSEPHPETDQYGT